MWAPLGTVWAVYEQAYGWLHGLRDLPVGDRAYLRIARTRYRWRRVELPDGTTLQRGDRVLIIHLHNPSLAEMGRQAGSPRRAGLAFRRGFQASLTVLAHALSADPALADVRAVGAVTNLWHGTRRLGFSVYPLPGRWWARLVAMYQQRLRCWHAVAPDQARRAPEAAGRGEARFIWISASALRRRYEEPEASSPARLTSRRVG
jgi:peptidoglycan-N-acetylglucosamine deacetylase